MAEDFMPGPPQAVTQKRLIRRAVVLWGVLIVLFAVVYALMSVDDKRAPVPVPNAHAGYSGVVVLVVAVIGAVAWIVVGMLIWQAVIGKRFNLDQRKALEALAMGDFTGAAKMFAELAQRYRKSRAAVAVATYNQAVALRYAGQAELAIPLLIGIERTSNLNAGEIRTLLAIETSVCFALGGDTPKAAKWLDDARGRVKGIGNPATQAAQIDHAQALVLCREGKYAEALELYETAWRRLEGMFPAARMREAHALRAFALASSGNVRDSAAPEAWLRILRMAPPGALAYMTAHWPELATFAAAHEVACLAEPVISATATKSATPESHAQV
jgi:tetratricopeptide (TPR) repeat protein